MTEKPNTDALEDDATLSETEGKESPKDEQDGATQSDAEGGEELGEAGKKALEKERDRAKAAEKRAKEAERKLKDLEAAKATEEDGKLTELDRTTKERDKWRTEYEKLEGSLKQERLTSSAMAIAGKLGAIEPSAVASLVKLADVEWSDELTPANADELVAGVKKAYPRLFSATPGNGNGGDRPATRTTAASTPIDRMRNAYASKT